MKIFLLFLVVVIFAVVFVVVLYNRLVELRQERQQAFADIDVHLKMRADLVPNLVETVKGYATHEKETLDNVTQARAQTMQAGGTQGRATAEAALGMALTQLMAVAENYPDLKANENFLHLQKELGDVENKISAARRYLNNTTREYNTAIEQFPSSVIANFFHFQQATFFDIGEPARLELEKGIKVSFSRQPPLG